MRYLLSILTISLSILPCFVSMSFAQAENPDSYDGIEQLDALSENLDAEMNINAGNSSSNLPGPTEPASDGAEMIDLSDLDLEDSDSDWKRIANPRALNITDSINVQEIIDPDSDYRYSSFGKADPFSAPSDDFIEKIRSDLIKDGPIAGEEIPILSPLQAHAIDKLMVSGVWIRKKDRTARAVVVTPKGEAIVVKAGDPISAGKVLEIRRDYLLTRQYNIRSDGVREFEDIKLTVRKEADKESGFIRLIPGKKPQFFDAKKAPSDDAAKVNIMAPAAPAPVDLPLAPDPVDLPLAPDPGKNKANL